MHVFAGDQQSAALSRVAVDEIVMGYRRQRLVALSPLPLRIALLRGEQIDAQRAGQNSVRIIRGLL